MKYFIFGCFFIIIFPILDGLVELSVQAIQLARATLAVKTLKYNNLISAAAAEKQEEQEHHYGFVTLPEPQPIQQAEEDDE